MSYESLLELLDPQTSFLLLLGLPFFCVDTPMKFIAILFVIISGFVGISPLLAKTPDGNSSFVSLADIHLNPFAGCEDKKPPCGLAIKLTQANTKEWQQILQKEGPTKLSYYSQDTNAVLFNSMLSKLKQVDKSIQPAFVLIIGDFLAHDFRGKYIKFTGDKTNKGFTIFVKKTLQYISEQIHQTFPEINIYSVVGNNDSYTGNYQSDPNGQFFAEVSTIFAGNIKNTKQKDELLNTFARGGYYSITLSSQLRLIILNTVLFSSKDKKPEVKKAAAEQLQWLNNELKVAAKNKQKILLTFHIPFGIDVYSTLRENLRDIIEFWDPSFTKVFKQELNDNASMIEAILPGHIHMDAYQLFAAGNKNIPIIFTPAISPIYGNNPGFKVFYYDSSTSKLTNYDTFYLPLNALMIPSWHEEYSFNKEYQPNCRNCSLTSGVDLIRQSNLSLNKYQEYFRVKGIDKASIQKYWKPYYFCNMKIINSIKYRECLEG